MKKMSRPMKALVFLLWTLATVGMAWCAYMHMWPSAISLSFMAVLYTMILLSMETVIDKVRRKWFPRKLPVHPSTMNVVVIDEDNPELNEVFGVTKERGNEILEAMRTETGNDTSFVNALVSMSKNCKHPNELMYMSFMIGGHFEAQKNPLAQILGSVMRKGE